jgi:beta-N-acetylhexosaminidase
MARCVKGLCVLAVVVLLGADRADPEPATKPPRADVRGKVTQVTALRARGLVGSLLVVGVKEKDTSHDRASVRLTSETKFHRWAAGKKQAAKFTDIKVGVKVQCVFIGPVAESYPVQARASEVLILDGK